MSLRARILALVVICVVAVAVSITYALSVHHQRQTQNSQAASTAPATTSVASIEGGPRIVFRSTALGNAYGKIAMVSLANPGGPRALSSTSCDRVYAAQSKLLCLSSDLGIVNTYKAEVLSNSFATQATLPLAGIPSRARLSDDGTLAATTSFTAGDSYAGTGFSTRTVVSRLTGKLQNSNLEDFTLLHNGSKISPVDRNYWGVTFAQDDRNFYVTVAWGGQTYLAHGDLNTRTITTLRTDAECPSLSPDGKTVVYKKRNGQPAGHWRLASYDIATGKETLLAETRNVDDQVDWLDSSTVLYGIARSGAQAAIDDIFEVPADGSGAPKLLIPEAWSPAVIH